MATPAIEIRDLYFRWPGAAGFSLSVPELEIAATEKVFVLGSSGSGKSTLLNLLAGILAPQNGSIDMLGTGFSALSTRQKDRFRARNIGIIFQQFNLIPYLDVATNIRLATHFGDADANGTRQNMVSVLDSLRMNATLLTRRADSLSVGQQQRVAIARALINKPGIIIADEPTSALDSAARDSFMQVLLRVQEEYRATIIFVSHDRTLARYFPRVLDMADINRVNRTPDYRAAV